MRKKTGSSLTLTGGASDVTMCSTALTMRKRRFVQFAASFVVVIKFANDDERDWVPV